MIKILCDRCGKEISDGNVGYIATNWRSMTDGTLLGDNPHEEKHFCSSCMKEIEQFVIKTTKNVIEDCKNVPKEAESVLICEKQTPEPEQPKEKQSRRRIDYGKITALRKAGWSIEKIADEMDMTKASVYTAISTYKKKNSGGNPRDIISIQTFNGISKVIRKEWGRRRNKLLRRQQA